MKDNIYVQDGPVLNGGNTHLVINYESWLCYMTLLDCFTSEEDSRAFVLINIDGSTKIVQVRSGSAIDVLGNCDVYKQVADAGYRWIYLFDCLLSLYQVDCKKDKYVKYNWLQKYIPDAFNKNEYLFNGWSKLVLGEGLMHGGFKYIGHEKLRMCTEEHLYDKYEVGSLSAELPNMLDFSCLDDCIYSLDCSNMSPGVAWLHYEIKDSKLMAYYYVRSGK